MKQTTSARLVRIALHLDSPQRLQLLPEWPRLVPLARLVRIALRLEWLQRPQRRHLQMARPAGRQQLGGAIFVWITLHLQRPQRPHLHSDALCRRLSRLRSINCQPQRDATSGHNLDASANN